MYEYVEVKNQADNMIYTMEKTLNENGDKLEEADRKKLEEAIEKAKKDFESEDVEILRKGIEELSAVSNEVFTKLYQNAQAQNANNAEKKDGDDNPEVVVD